MSASIHPFSRSPKQSAVFKVVAKHSTDPNALLLSWAAEIGVSITEEARYELCTDTEHFLDSGLVVRHSLKSMGVNSLNISDDKLSLHACESQCRRLPARVFLEWFLQSEDLPIGISYMLGKKVRFIIEVKKNGIKTVEIDEISSPINVTYSWLWLWRPEPVRMSI